MLLPPPDVVSPRAHCTGDGSLRHALQHVADDGSVPTPLLHVAEPGVEGHGDQPLSHPRQHLADHQVLPPKLHCVCRPPAQCCSNQALRHPGHHLPHHGTLPPPLDHIFSPGAHRDGQTHLDHAHEGHLPFSVFFQSSIVLAFPFFNENRLIFVTHTFDEFIKSLLSTCLLFTSFHPRPKFDRKGTTNVPCSVLI